MKSILPLRTMLFLAFLISAVAGNAQSFNGGSIVISSPCYSLTAPAPTINSLSGASGGTAPYSYQWQAKINPSQWVDVIVGGTGETLSPGILMGPTSYRRKATDANGLAGYSNIVDFTISDGVTGGTVRNSGSYENILVNTSPALFVSYGSAQNGSGTYTYLWETATSESGPWTSTGATTLDYQSPIITNVGSFYFRRKATDVNCGGIGYSNVIKIVTHHSLPFVPNDFTYAINCVFPGNQPPLLSGLAPYGGTAPYSYQWEYRTLNGTWSTIPGATGASYQPGIMTESIIFRRKASDAAGAWGYSNEDMITYAPLIPIPGIIAPNSLQLIAPNAPASSVVNVASASDAYNGTYFWEISADNGTTWVPVPNYNHSSLYIEFSPSERKCYRRGINSTCATGNKIAVTNFVCMDPVAPFAAGSISHNSSTNACVGVGTPVGAITGTPATGGNIPYTYLWQKKENGVWINIPSSDAVNYNPGILSDNAIFRRKVTDASNASLYSNEVTISIRGTSNLKGGIIDGPIITCSGTAPGIINNIIDACGGGGSLNYVWESSTAGGAWAAIANTNQPTYNATSISADTKFRRKVGDGCGNGGYSNEVEVFVYPAIEPGTIYPANQTVCSNQATEVLSLMQNCHYTNGSVSYQWQKSSAADGNWADVTGPIGTNSFHVPSSTTSSYYRLKVSSTVCGAVAYSNVAKVTVNNCNGNTLNSIGDQLRSSSLTVRGNMKIYPNLTSQGQTVTVSIEGEEGNYKANLRSTDGRMYNCTVMTSGKGQLQVKLPSLMSKGTYLVQVSNNKKQWIERIVVQ